MCFCAFVYIYRSTNESWLENWTLATEGRTSVFYGEFSFIPSEQQNIKHTNFCYTYSCTLVECC